MAFNPFDVFRKRQRTLMAGVIILAMFVFVLSSGVGEGDFFSQLQNWFTERSYQYATMYGEEISQEYLQQVRAQRQLANEYIAIASALASSKLAAQAQEVLRDAQLNQEISMYMGMRARPEGGPNITGMFLFGGDQFPGLAPELDSNLQSAIWVMEHSQPDDEAKHKRELQALKNLRKVIRDDLRRLLQGDDGRNPGRTIYFNTIRARDEDSHPFDERGLLEFVLWSKKAERMGINLTTAEVNSLVVQETNNMLVDDPDSEWSWPAVENRLSDRYRSLGGDTIIAALKQEFQVRIAQKALLGLPGDDEELPAMSYPTPYEAWQFFQDNRTTMRLTFIEVPTDDFLDQVKKEPTEAEVQELFDAHKRREPDPSREDPGFRVPRRVKVAFVGGTASDYYRDAAPRVLKISEAMAQLSGPLSIPAGGGFAGPLANNLLTLAGSEQSLLWGQYQNEVEKDINLWFDPNTPFPTALHHDSIWRPENVAALVGQAFGSSGTGAPMFSSTNTFLGSAVRAEIRSRVQLGGAALVPVAPGALAAIGPVIVALPEPVPFEAVRDQLRQDFLDREAVTAFESDMNTLHAEIQRLGQEPDPRTKVNEYVKKFAEERGLRFEEPDRWFDQFSFEGEVGPEMEVLRERNMRENFGDNFLGNTETFFSGWFPAAPSDEDNVFRDSFYRVWLSADEPSHVPDLNEENVRDKVVTAWKRIRARDLAKARADKLAASLKTKRAGQLNTQSIRDFVAEQELGDLNVFEVPDVAKLVRRFTGGARNVSYEPYSAQSIRFSVPEIEHPTDEMAEQLLELQSKDLGASVVLSDAPRKHFYVATLVDRQAPWEGFSTESMAGNIPLTDNFLQTYIASARTPFRSRLDTLISEHLTSKKYSEARELILEQLKAEADFHFIEDEED